MPMPNDSRSQCRLWRAGAWSQTSSVRATFRATFSVSIWTTVWATIWVATWIASCVLTARPAQAQPRTATQTQTQTAGCDRPLRVGMSDLGLGGYMEEGRPRGVIPELIKELEVRSGCRLQIIPVPRARALLEFSDGKLDIVTSMLKTPERDRAGVFLPYGYAKQDLLLLPEAGPGIKSLAELRSHPQVRVGLVRGIQAGERLDTRIEDLVRSRQLEYSPDFFNLAAKLNARRLQAALMPNALHIKLRRDGLLPLDLIVQDEPEAPPQPLGLYVNRRTVPDAVLARLEGQLAAMVSSGWVRQTYARHLGEEETRRMYRAAGHS